MDLDVSTNPEGRGDACDERSMNVSPVAVELGIIDVMTPTYAKDKLYHRLEPISEPQSRLSGSLRPFVPPPAMGPVGCPRG